MIARTRWSKIVVAWTVIAVIPSLGHAQQGAPGIGPGAILSEIEKSPTADPIAAVGYGLLFDSDGKTIKPTPEFRRRAQLYYINRLVSEAPPSIRAEFAKMRQRIDRAKTELGMDETVSQSLLIDWLIEKVVPTEPIFPPRTGPCA
jgi:hypothetical protein